MKLFQSFFILFFALQLVEGQQLHRTVCFEHFAKSGGTYIRTILRQLDIDFIISNEFERACDKNKHFVIGALREPASYYVSMWSYGAKLSGRFFDSFEFGDGEPVINGLPLYGDPEDNQYFINWYNHITSVNPYGLWTYRVMYKYYNGSYLMDDVKHLVSPAYDNYEVEFIDILTHNVNCWIETSFMEENIRVCLQQYAAETGYPLNEPQLEETLIEGRKLGHNKSKHRECSYYWTPKLLTILLAKDGPLIKALNATICKEEYTTAFQGIS